MAFHLQAKDLAQEVLEHIRQVAGPDAVLVALNEARQTITSSRIERKRQQAVRVSLSNCMLWMIDRFSSPMLGINFL